MMLKAIFLLVITLMISCGSSDGLAIPLPFKFEGMDEWTLEGIEADDAAINKYQFINRDEVEMVISVNENSNDLIMCFCAPMDQYEKVKHDKYTTYQWPKPTDSMYEKIFTMKWQGLEKSLDIHFVFDDNANRRDGMIKLFRSIQLVEE